MDFGRYKLVRNINKGEKEVEVGVGKVLWCGIVLRRFFISLISSVFVKVGC